MLADILWLTVNMLDLSRYEELAILGVVCRVQGDQQGCTSPEQGVLRDLQPVSNFSSRPCGGANFQVSLVGVEVYPSTEAGSY